MSISINICLQTYKIIERQEFGAGLDVRDHLIFLREKGSQESQDEKMPVNSSYRSTLLPGDTTLLQGLELDLQNIRIKVTPASMVILHLFIQTFG